MRKHFVQSKAVEPTVEPEREYSGYLGRVHTVNLYETPNKFPGQDWLEDKIKRKGTPEERACGMFFGWKDDRTKDDNHGLAIIAIADESNCILFRVHQSGRYLPDAFANYLQSALCEKFVFSWGAMAHKKFQNSFDNSEGGVVEILNVTDVSVLAVTKGIDKVGLSSVAEVVGPLTIKPKPKLDWLVDTLSPEVERYAVDTAYFSFVVAQELEKIDTIEKFADHTNQFESCLTMEAGWEKQGIERRNDGLYCILCPAGPIQDAKIMKAHVNTERHMRKAGMWEDPDEPVQAQTCQSCSEKKPKASKLDKMMEDLGFKPCADPGISRIPEPPVPLPTCCKHGCARNCFHGCHDAGALTEAAIPMASSAPGSAVTASPSPSGSAGTEQPTKTEDESMASIRSLLTASIPVASSAADGAMTNRTSPSSKPKDKPVVFPQIERIHSSSPLKRSEGCDYDAFTGKLLCIDLATVSRRTEAFEGSSWFEEQLTLGKPLGWDIEWRPDPCRGSDNPVALMQFSSMDTAILLRTHVSLKWLPKVVSKVLVSERVAKIGVGYDGPDKKKMINSFGLEPVNVVDLAEIAKQVGLKQRGLKTLGQACGLIMLKSEDTAVSDWASRRELTSQQKQYAAEDAYFSLVIYKELMKYKIWFKNSQSGGGSPTSNKVVEAASGEVVSSSDRDVPSQRQQQAVLQSSSHSQGQPESQAQSQLKISSEDKRRSGGVQPPPPPPSSQLPPPPSSRKGTSEGYSGGDSSQPPPPPSSQLPPPPSDQSEASSISHKEQRESLPALIVSSAILEARYAVRAPPEGFDPSTFLMLEKGDRLRCIVEPDADGWLWGSRRPFGFDAQGWVNVDSLTVPTDPMSQRSVDRAG